MAAQNGQEGTIRLCARLGGSVDAGTAAGGATFYSPIKVAAANGHLGCMKTLIDLGATTNPREYMHELSEADREDLSAWLKNRAEGIADADGSDADQAIAGLDTLERSPSFRAPAANATGKATAKGVDIDKAYAKSSKSVERGGGRPRSRR